MIHLLVCIRKMIRYNLSALKVWIQFMKRQSRTMHFSYFINHTNAFVNTSLTWKCQYLNVGIWRECIVHFYWVSFTLLSIIIQSNIFWRHLCKYFSFTFRIFLKKKNYPEIMDFYKYLMFLIMNFYYFFFPVYMWDFVELRNHFCRYTFEIRKSTH